MARQKAISVKIATPKVIHALETALAKLEADYTSQKSKVTGTILEIKPQANNTVRVKLDVNGNTRWTTWTAQ